MDVSAHVTWIPIIQGMDDSMVLLHVNVRLISPFAIISSKCS